MEYYQSKRYCSVLVVQQGGGLCISPHGGAFWQPDNTFWTDSTAGDTRIMLLSFIKSHSRISWAVVLAFYASSELCVSFAAGRGNRKTVRFRSEESRAHFKSLSPDGPSRRAPNPNSAPPVNQGRRASMSPPFPRLSWTKSHLELDDGPRELSGGLPSQAGGEQTCPITWDSLA